MNKRYTVKPIDTITLDFEDGTSLVLRLDTKAMYHLTKDFDMAEIFKNEDVEEICGAIIYSASVEHTEDMTIERAMWIARNIPMELSTNIMNDFQESLGADLKENQKKTMQEFLNKKLSR